jgi:uncharacterized membrane protein YfcA
MKIILIICLAVSLYFILRSSTTAFTHWLGYKYRKETNIERIKEKQEKVDILVGIYKIYVTLFWGFNIKILVNILYNIPFNNIIYTNYWKNISSQSQIYLEIIYLFNNFY